MEIVILVVAILIVAGAGAAFVSARRGPDRGTVLEPPPAPPRIERPPTTSPPLPVDDLDLNEPSSGVAVAPEPEVLPTEVEPDLVEEIEEALAPVVEKPRFRDRLGKARGTLAGYLGSIRSRGKIDAELWDELEEALIRA